jgi:hypothetical protein
VPEEPGPSDEIAGQRELLSRLRAVVEAKDAENAVLRRCRRRVKTGSDPYFVMVSAPSRSGL